MNRNSHLLLISTTSADQQGQKQNGIYSQALNSRNIARQSQQLRAPLGVLNYEINTKQPELKLKKRQSQIDPTVSIKVKNIR